MDELVKFAKRELALLRSSDEPDEMQDVIEKHVLDIVQMFADAGHSGSSANYTINILEKVLRFEPVTPLTGADDEWTDLDYDGDMKAQNKRCGHVFKRADGTTYDSEAIIFQHQDGTCFTSGNSRKNITFPYRPSREYVKVDEQGNPLNMEQSK